jgi:hypothetical protein
MREIRTYGSVRAKAEWLSYSTILDPWRFELSSEVKLLSQILTAHQNQHYADAGRSYRKI